jgi:hypothetical protein
VFLFAGLLLLGGMGWQVGITETPAPPTPC